MTELQEKALKTAKTHINNAYMMILREATNPSDAVRSGTHSSEVMSEISTAETWIRIVIDDNKESNY